MQDEAWVFFWPKRCACGAVYDPSGWLALERKGRQVITELESVELRNCSACQSTVSVPFKSVPSPSVEGLGLACFVERAQDGFHALRLLLADEGRKVFVGFEVRAEAPIASWGSDLVRAIEHAFWEKVCTRSRPTFEQACRFGWVPKEREP